MTIKYVTLNLKNTNVKLAELGWNPDKIKDEEKALRMIEIIENDYGGTFTVDDGQAWIEVEGPYEYSIVKHIYLVNKKLLSK